MASTQTTAENPVETLLWVQHKLSALSDGGMLVKTKGPLIAALDKLSCFPLMSMSLTKTDPSMDNIFIGGEAAGNMDQPDVDVIMAKSTPSPFGRGDKTVMDESYRSGREIPASDIHFKDVSGSSTAYEIGEKISPAMFLGRKVELKLYKLAIYKDGGHFDWHMDTTHSDRHHATALVALNTSWVGGDLILRRNGVETRIGLKPRMYKKFTTSALQAVVFYTDTEHKVEPVTEGVRIVLQYDVEVTGWNEKEGKEEAAHKEEESGVRDSDVYSMMDMMDVDESNLLSSTAKMNQKRKVHKGPPPDVGDPEVVKTIIDIIKNLLDSGQDEVAFAVQYLYRKASIRPEFLKGSDGLLYQALLEHFEVKLSPVVLSQWTDWEGKYEACTAFRFDHTSPIAEGSDTDTDSDTESEPKRQSTPHIVKAEFYMPNTSAIKVISERGYIEHTGNEAQPGSAQYYGGGMFVSRKQSD